MLNNTFSLSRVKLRPLAKDDLTMVLNWRNSDNVRRFMISDKIISSDEHKKWFLNSINDDSCEYLVAMYKEKPIGLVSITDIKDVDKTCTWGMYIAKKNVELGVGVLMEIAAIDRMFYFHKVRKIWGQLLSSNRIRFLHKRAGFTEEGVLKKHVFRGGIYEDLILVSIFSHEWKDSRVNMVKSLNLN